MTTPRKTTRKTTRLKRRKLENLFRHANGVYWVRAKVNGKSVERKKHLNCRSSAGWRHTRSFLARPTASDKWLERD